MNPIRLIGAGWFVGGIAMIVLNRWLAERGIEFQRSIGSFTSGRKTLIFMRAIGVLGGCFFSVVGLLMLLGLFPSR